MWGELKDAVQKDMREFVEAEGGEALQRLEIADAFYGEYADVIKHKKIQNLIKIDSGKVIDSIFKPNAIDEVNLVKKAMGIDNFMQLEEGFMNKLRGVGKDDVFNPDNLRRNLIRYGDDMLNNIFGESAVKELKRVAKEGLDLTIHTPGSRFLKTIAQTDPDRGAVAHPGDRRLYC